MRPRNWLALAAAVAAIGLIAWVGWKALIHDVSEPEDPSRRSGHGHSGAESAAAADERETWKRDLLAIRKKFPAPRTWVRLPIVRGHYATHGLSLWVLGFDRDQRRGVVEIIGDKAVEGVPISALLVEVDGDRQTVLLERSMAVPYDSGAVKQLFEYWGTEQADQDLTEALRQAGEEWNRQQAAAESQPK